MTRAERDETLAMLREAARDFCAAELERPVTDEPGLRALWMQMAQLGWLGVALPEATGGSGLGLAGAGMIALELGAVAQMRGFAETVAVCRQVGFSKIHMFPFSPRRGTPAAEMGDQISKQTKHDRGVELARVETELRAVYYASLEGMPLRVLVESPLGPPPSQGGARGGIPDAPQHIGTSCRYAPVALPAVQAPIGAFVDVIAGPITGNHLTATLTAGGHAQRYSDGRGALNDGAATPCGVP